jgi:hypothetical protein|eukprot:SAG25_NODE_64_length_17680_cov_5.716398_2_plen_192_part_00
MAWHVGVARYGFDSGSTVAYPDTNNNACVHNDVHGTMQCHCGVCKLLRGTGKSSNTAQTVSTHRYTSRPWDPTLAVTCDRRRVEITRCPSERAVHIEKGHVLKSIPGPPEVQAEPRRELGARQPPNLQQACSACVLSVCYARAKRASQWITHLTPRNSIGNVRSEAVGLNVMATDGFWKLPKVTRVKCVSE